MMKDFDVKDLKLVDFTEHVCADQHTEKFVIIGGMFKLDFDFFKGAAANGSKVIINGKEVINPFKAREVAEKWISSVAKEKANKENFLSALKMLQEQQQ